MLWEIAPSLQWDNIIQIKYYLIKVYSSAVVKEVARTSSEYRMNLSALRTALILSASFIYFFHSGDQARPWSALSHHDTAICLLCMGMSLPRPGPQGSDPHRHWDSCKVRLWTQDWTVTFGVVYNYTTQLFSADKRWLGYSKVSAALRMLQLVLHSQTLTRTLTRNSLALWDYVAWFVNGNVSTSSYLHDCAWKCISACEYILLFFTAWKQR